MPLLNSNLLKGSLARRATNVRLNIQFLIFHYPSAFHNAEALSVLALTGWLLPPPMPPSQSLMPYSFCYCCCCCWCRARAFTCVVCHFVCLAVSAPLSSGGYTLRVYVVLTLFGVANTDYTLNVRKRDMNSHPAAAAAATSPSCAHTKWKTEHRSMFDAFALLLLLLLLLISHTHTSIHNSCDRSTLCFRCCERISRAFALAHSAKPMLDGNVLCSCIAHHHRSYRGI